MNRIVDELAADERIASLYDLWYEQKEEILRTYIDSEGMLISAVHEVDGREGLNLLMVNDRIPAGAKLY